MTSTTLRLCDSGRTVALQDAGGGAPVVLVHGVGLCAEAWAPQIAALSQHHRVIAVDMPGHGSSEPLPEGSELPDFVAWLAEVIETLGCGPVAVAGHSMGALIAGGLAVDYPALTHRVALLNGVFRRAPEARAAVEMRATGLLTGQVDNETPLTRWFSDSPAEAGARADVARWLNAVDPAGYATAYGAFARGDTTYADRYSQITGPFMALTGDGDPNSTPAMSRTMAETVQDGRDVVVIGHRHMVNLTAPQIVNANLAHWLDAPALQDAAQ